MSGSGGTVVLSVEIWVENDRGVGRRKRKYDLSFSLIVFVEEKKNFCKNLIKKEIYLKCYPILKS